MQRIAGGATFSSFVNIVRFVLDTILTFRLQRILNYCLHMLVQRIVRCLQQWLYQQDKEHTAQWDSSAKQ